jgi:hypothetical protein
MPNQVSCASKRPEKSHLNFSHDRRSIIQQMIPYHDSDLVAFLETAEKRIGGELDLTQLGRGDRLLVRTRNTTYLFAMTGPRSATLSSDRPDRPSGPVVLRGCVFGQSSTIKPDHLFCGGGLEILANGGAITHTTSPIETLQLTRATGAQKSG